MDQELESTVRALSDLWRRRATRAMECAAAQDPADEFGRRFIEHGAMCYFNCARELMEATRVSLSHEPSATPEEQQKLLRLLAQ